MLNNCTKNHFYTSMSSKTKNLIIYTCFKFLFLFYISVSHLTHCLSLVHFLFWTLRKELSVFVFVKMEIIFFKRFPCEKLKVLRRQEFWIGF